MQKGIGLPDDAVRELIHRHQQGDHGEIGRLKDVELDDDRRWAPPAFGRLAMNAAAIEEGAGLVHSVFNVQVPRYTGGMYPRLEDEPGRAQLVTHTPKARVITNAGPLDPLAFWSHADVISGSRWPGLRGGPA